MSADVLRVPCHVQWSFAVDIVVACAVASGLDIADDGPIGHFHEIEFYLGDKFCFGGKPSVLSHMPAKHLWLYLMDVLVNGLPCALQASLNECNTTARPIATELYQPWGSILRWSR